MVKYAAYRLRDEGVRINALRSRAIKTESFDGTFGQEFYGFLNQFVSEEWFMKPEEVGRAAFALCSGLFDGVSGQTIMVDRGNTFFDGIRTSMSAARRLAWGSRPPRWLKGGRDGVGREPVQPGGFLLFGFRQPADAAGGLPRVAPRYRVGDLAVRADVVRSGRTDQPAADRRPARSGSST